MFGEWKNLLAVVGVREARLHGARHTADDIRFRRRLHRQRNEPQTSGLPK